MNRAIMGIGKYQFLLSRQTNIAFISKNYNYTRSTHLKIRILSFTFSKCTTLPYQSMSANVIDFSDMFRKNRYNDEKCNNDKENVHVNTLNNPNVFVDDSNQDIHCTKVTETKNEVRETNFRNISVSDSVYDDYH